jgi:hypothetical protein
MEPKNRFQGMNSASLCGLAGRYENPIPTRCLAPIDCLKIPALVTWKTKRYCIAFYESYSYPAFQGGGGGGCIAPSLSAVAHVNSKSRGKRFYLLWNGFFREFSNLQGLFSLGSTVHLSRMRYSRVVGASGCQCKVLGSIPVSSDTVESEGRQMKQC